MTSVIALNGKIGHKGRPGTRIINISTRHSDLFTSMCHVRELSVIIDKYHYRILSYLRMCFLELFLEICKPLWRQHVKLPTDIHTTCDLIFSVLLQIYSFSLCSKNEFEKVTKGNKSPLLFPNFIKLERRRMSIS